MVKLLRYYVSEDAVYLHLEHVKGELLKNTVLSLLLRQYWSNLLRSAHYIFKYLNKVYCYTIASALFFLLPIAISFVHCGPRWEALLQAPQVEE